VKLDITFVNSRGRQEKPIISCSNTVKRLGRKILFASYVSWDLRNRFSPLAGKMSLFPLIVSPPNRNTHEENWQY